MELVLASRNSHKVREFSLLLKPHTVLQLPDCVALPPETGATFAENALPKARAAAAASGLAAVADDSGIVVDGLKGVPGVLSARYAGEGASDSDNLEKLLADCSDLSDRSAHYVCALALVMPDGSEEIFEARWDGFLTDQPRGSGGFGYDPIFVPKESNDGRTAAELSQAEKDQISHRGQAVKLLLAYLRERNY